MIEIFRTNVMEQKNADAILNKIHSAFPGFRANFDLMDCDRILRVCSHETLICTPTLIALVSDLGFKAEVLPDTIPEVHPVNHARTEENPTFH
ncbi:MAG TPA: hypothetical protein VGD65_19815 [Chryseosolibacter sp.]